MNNSKVEVSNRRCHNVGLAYCNVGPELCRHPVFTGRPVDKVVAMMSFANVVVQIYGTRNRHYLLFTIT